MLMNTVASSCQHNELPAFGWAKLSRDESLGGTSNDGVVITRGFARANTGRC